MIVCRAAIRDVKEADDVDVSGKADTIDHKARYERSLKRQSIKEAK